MTCSRDNGSRPDLRLARSSSSHWSDTWPPDATSRHRWMAESPSFADRVRGGRPNGQAGAALHPPDPKCQQQRDDARVSGWTADVGLDEPPVMDHAGTGRDVNQPMQAVPALAPES